MLLTLEDVAEVIERVMCDTGVIIHNAILKILSEEGLCDYAEEDSEVKTN